MGAWTLVYMGGYALGPLIGGVVLDAVGGRAAFALVGACGLLGAALFVRCCAAPPVRACPTTRAHSSRSRL